MSAAVSVAAFCLLYDNELVEREKIGRKLRASAAVLSFEKIVRERFGN